MFNNLNAEMARKGLNNSDVAEYLGISVVSYTSKKKSGKFNTMEVKKLLALFGCKFEYLFETA